MTSHSDAARLIAEIDALGAKMTVAGDNLKVDAPTPLPEELLVRLRLNKREIIKGIGGSDGAGCVQPMSTLVVPAPVDGESGESSGGLHSRPTGEPAFWSWLVDGAPDETGDARKWRERYRDVINGLAVGDTLTHARVCAWSVLQRAWHRQHGQKPDPNICAGCGGSIIGQEYFEDDGARCHLHGEGDAAVACIIAYGAYWRWAADEGLRALGLVKPEIAPTGAASKLEN
jgi:hypothetical protein